MAILPPSTDSFLIRTVSEHGAEWDALCEAVRTESADGFRAYVRFVDDPTWYGSTADELRDAVPRVRDDRASVLFAVDERALTETGFPVMVVDLNERRQPFRSLVEVLWSVDNNLNLANMDWEEFADAADQTGVYRGF